MKLKWKKSLSILLAALLLAGLLPVSALAAGDAITRQYGDFVFEKISNPGTGAGEADGINTNDVSGFGPNRLNSYAWAVATRGDYIYIGTNRTLFGSALNAVAEQMRAKSDLFTPELLGKAITLISGGAVPVNLEEEDYIPQIIRFDVKNGTTRVIYQPNTARNDDGVLCYTDKDGNVIPAADVASETASFRSVVEFHGNLYFGSLGVNMLQLVRVDEDDQAEVVFQTFGVYSSLRACCVHDAGDGETIYYGGQDATNPKWQKAYSEGKNVLPIVIRALDPETAGTDVEDWTGLVADFEDFGQYAYATVYSSGGGNVWDLCSFNGKLYLVLAYDRGWALFRGEKGGANPNQYGWTWTEIVGDAGKYPLAMDEEIGELNEMYAAAYGCGNYAKNLNGAGLLESTATPFVFNGRMYLGTFDNATMLQSQTVIKALVKLLCIMDTEHPALIGPTLKQIFAPLYEALTHPQHIWVMDENETITPVEGANALLEGTTNDYVWRFIEYDGKLYAGTFDAASAYQYFLGLSVRDLMELLQENGCAILDQFDGGTFESFLARLEELLKTIPTDLLRSSGTVDALRDAALNACESVKGFLYDGGTTVEQLLDAMSALEIARGAVEQVTAKRGGDGLDALSGLIPEDVMVMIDKLLRSFDVEGLRYWAMTRELVECAEKGFDLLVTEDGEHWEAVVRDGLQNSSNYGARTFTICDDALYVGTANPYFGAQLWKITDNSPHVEKYDITVTDGKAAPETAAQGETVTVTADRREGYTFRSWAVLSGYAVLEDTSAAVTSFIMPANDVELKAEYTANESGSGGFAGGGETAYAVTVAAAANGKVSADRSSAPKGAAVKLTVTPDEGYELDTVTVKGASGADIAVTEANGVRSFVMPGEAVTVTADFKAKPKGDAPKPAEPADPLAAFGDLDPAAWYAEGVRYVLDKGYMDGTGKGVFQPDEKTTRAMVATVLWRMAGSPVADYAMPFADVSGDAWYAEAVRWAASQGIVEGWTDEATGKQVFAPDNIVTREQFATMLYRYAKLCGKGFTGLWSFRLDFPDVADVSDWALEAISWLVMHGVINGADGKLAPQGSSTRAQVAAMLQRYDTV